MSVPEGGEKNNRESKGGFVAESRMGNNNSGWGVGGKDGAGTIVIIVVGCCWSIHVVIVVGCW